MRKLSRPIELPELTVARKKYAQINSPEEAWSRFGDNGNREKVRKQLESTQNNLCAYCENSLGKAGHIDHFKPKSLDRKVTFDWENLIVSCCERNSCGEKKGEYYRSYWVNPYLKDPSGLFRFYANGQIKGRTPDAQSIIEDFGLDCPRLEEKRRTILSTYQNVLLSIVDDPEVIEYYLQETIEIFPTAHEQTIKNLLQ